MTPAKMFSMLSLLLLPLLLVSGERVQQIKTHTGSCFTCGMVEGVGYVTVQVCGSTDCCLSRSLDSDGINWLPGQTDTFQGDGILECANYEIGSAPYSISVFHDGTDGLTLSWIEVKTDMRTARCDVDAKLDDHNFVKATCY
eukprot:TRINITY_DN1499_c0_g1_i1.p1 TRINITY_DN1499_c0_g1~~TRINITY_DN1499_c0_g1_i1.p1  ORF type:complete len:142 (+),score=44.53 TRINITY_DN1499_c0_g1_i1:60-485(+)